MLLDFSFLSVDDYPPPFFAISITFAGDYPTAAFHFRASLPVTPPPSSSSVMEEEKKELVPSSESDQKITSDRFCHLFSATNI
jgi:hypothetical protein